VGKLDKLEGVLERIAERMATQSQHDALAQRLAMLEQRSYLSAGASAAENQNKSEAHEWLRTLAPLLWPIAVSAVGVFWALHGSAP
jgi:hypothetical protein